MRITWSQIPCLFMVSAAPCLIMASAPQADLTMIFLAVIKAPIWGDGTDLCGSLYLPRNDGVACILFCIPSFRTSDQQVIGFGVV